MNSTEISILSKWKTVRVPLMNLQSKGFRVIEFPKMLGGHLVGCIGILRREEFGYMYIVSVNFDGEVLKGELKKISSDSRLVEKARMKDKLSVECTKVECTKVEKVVKWIEDIQKLAEEL